MKKIISANSSVIKKIGFENNNLYILFNSNVSYKYFNVSSSIFENFIQSDSQGVFFNRYIKNNFQFEKLNNNSFFDENTETDENKNIFEIIKKIIENSSMDGIELNETDDENEINISDIISDIVKNVYSNNMKTENNISNKNNKKIRKFVVTVEEI